jgi:hypothetical protein
MYPSLALTSSGRLPETMPSNRVSVTTHGSDVVVDGRGWGHGVGMSQWGAEGLAAAGTSYEAILHHYYSGVSIGTVAEPRRVEVGLDWGLPEVLATGAFTLVDGRGQVLVPHALGAWRFDRADDGAILIAPPEGFGLPLRVGIAHSPPVVTPGQQVPVRIALSKPAFVTVGERNPAGSEAHAPRALKLAGISKLTWRAPAEPGHYTVVVAAHAGRARRTAATQVEVRAITHPPEDVDNGTQVPWLQIVIGALVAAMVLGVATSRMRSWKRP